MFLDELISEVRGFEMIGNRKLDHFVFGDRSDDFGGQLIRHVFDIVSEFGKRIADGHGSGRAISLGRLGGDDVKTGHDEDRARMVKQQVRTRLHIPVGHVRLESGHAAHVVLENYVLDLSKHVVVVHCGIHPRFVDIGVLSYITARSSSCMSVTNM